MTLSQAQGFVGAFDCFMAPINADGTLGLLKDVGNVTEFAPESKATIKNQISRKRDTYKQILETLAVQEPGQIKLTLETVNLTNLRYCVMGRDVEYSQAAAPAADHSVVMRKDGWVKLPHESLDDTVTVKNEAGTVTYNEGADYAVNRRTGMAMALIGGDIADGATVKINYSADAFTGLGVIANVEPQLRVYMFLDGLNKVDETMYFAHFWEAVLTPAGPFDFMKDDFNTIPLAGQLKTPPGKPSPYVIYAR